CAQTLLWFGSTASVPFPSVPSVRPWRCAAALDNLHPSERAAPLSIRALEFFLSSFSDPQSVARYSEGPARLVPGFHALHQMTALLLAEHVPEEGRVLVLGAGGGLELKAFAQAQPGWRFLGIDPSAQMLQLAEDTLGPLASRVELLEGYIDSAPATGFDGATC